MRPTCRPGGWTWGPACGATGVAGAGLPPAQGCPAGDPPALCPARRPARGPGVPAAAGVAGALTVRGPDAAGAAAAVRPSGRPVSRSTRADDGPADRVG